MSIELTILVAICGTIFGIVIGYLNWRRTNNEDIRKDAISDGKLFADIDYIKRGVEDIKLDLKMQDRRIGELSEKLISAEESIKSAHKRIDDIVK